tara:strand:+ start:1145 stop:1348 length:204 start_codon:yes stop_codon:yes gene_type:complete
MVSCWVDRLSGVFELSEHAAKSCLEAASLGGSELIRDDKAGEADQRLVDVFEALFELGGCGRGCRVG